MKGILQLSMILSLFLIGCSGGGDKEQMKDQFKTKAAPMTLEEAEKGWKDNHGVGPVAPFELPVEVDQTLAAEGQSIYEAKCTACHKPNKQFIGPAPAGVIKRRTPAWIMNMIMNPDEMVQKDPIAKQLLIKFNGSPMANQSLTQDESRAILEYFRTL